jgi:hypothetical protein
MSAIRGNAQTDAIAPLAIGLQPRGQDPYPDATLMVRGGGNAVPRQAATFVEPAARHSPGLDRRPCELAVRAVLLGPDEAPVIGAARIAIDGGCSVFYYD